MTEYQKQTINTMTENHHEDDYNYYNTHGAGRAIGKAQKPWTPEDTERILEAYHDNISDTISGSVARVIETAYKHGLTVDEIIMAIEETGFAPRPSPQYMRAILERWAEVGVTVSRIQHYAKANNGLKWWKE